MITKRFILAIYVLIFLMLSVIPIIAQDQTEWQNLFDGKTLNDWIQSNGTAKFEFSDGMIVGTTVPGSPNSFLCIQDLGFNDAQPPLSDDPFMGDWQTNSADLVAQIFPLGDGRYQANLFKTFGTADAPIAVMQGMLDSNGISFKSEQWTGSIDKHRFNCQKGNENYEMRRVTRRSPTLNMPPPENAIILFDGSNLDAWSSQKQKEWETADGPADDWKILPGGRLEVVPGTGSIITKQKFSDFKLHLEFRLLGEKTNGGIYLLARYEINIKDSYGQLEGLPCGAPGNISVPKLKNPIVNMAAPHFQWQTFDIDFRAPQFDESGQQKIENARITVVFNGVTLYKNFEPEELKGAAKRLGEAPNGPIMLQEHGTAYQFRNIWIMDKSR